MKFSRKLSERLSLKALMNVSEMCIRDSHQRGEAGHVVERRDEVLCAQLRHGGIHPRLRNHLAKHGGKRGFHRVGREAAVEAGIWWGNGSVLFAAERYRRDLSGDIEPRKFSYSCGAWRNRARTGSECTLSLIHI